MNEKTKAFIGLGLSIIMMIIMVFFGYAEQYPIFIWVLGWMGGLSISKIVKF